MRRRLSREQDESEINLTPMLDVTFIMLIFFIVTASFVKEAGIDVRKEQATQAETKARASIFIAISPNGQVWIDKRQVDVRAVADNVQRLRAENPEGQVIIQADRDSKNGVLIQVMDQVKQAGVDNISLAAELVE